MENPGEYHSVDTEMDISEQQSNTSAHRRPLVKMRGLYPIGGPKIIREEFEKLGFEYRPPNTPNEECDSFWVMRFDPPEFKAMRWNQKVNYLPGMTELCIKSMLHSNIVKMKEKFGEEPFSFWPRGFNLPEEYDKLKKYYEDNGDKQIPFIIKPARRACGTGITCITHVSQISPEDEFIKTETPVAQEYVMNPILLDGFKISFRIYVAITSVSPLRIYVHPSGLTRISSEKYRTDLESFGNGANFIHLTNYDLNKFNKENFANLVSPEIKHDNMRCEMQYIFDTLRQNGHNVDALWEEIKEAIVKSFLAAEQRITTAVSRIVHFRSNGYELLGFDFLVDENMKPWLLEVNHAPNLEPHTELETKVKRAAIRDLLQLVDVARVDAISTEEETKQKFEKLQHYIATMEPEEESDIMLSKLTKSDVWKIVATQRENNRRGDFQRLYPNPDSGKYNEIAWPNRENQLVIKLMDFFESL